MKIIHCLGLLLLIATGCGHAAMNGSVVMATTPNEGHVCLAEGSVAVGDRVAILRHVCTNNGRAGVSCSSGAVGQGEVTSLLGSHYATVRALDGVELHEGDSIRPQ